MIDAKFFIELIGYVGSGLVVVSMLMTSLKKLRIINMIGSLIFTVYALIIHSYPTALMNLCLVLINIYNLRKLHESSPHYYMYESNGKDASFRYLINYYKDDILHFFPDTNLETIRECNTVYMVVSDTTPVGFLVGNRIDAHTIDIIVDYTTAKYRDTTVGVFLYREIAKLGIRKLKFCVSSIGHDGYLKKMGFTHSVEGFVKEL